MPPRLKAVRLAASTFLPRPQASSTTPLLAPFLVPQRSASILASLSDNPGAYHKKIRRGRGPASGKGKTAGRGQKGQHAHGKVPTGFEGGQTPLSITTPVRGRNKYNPFKVEMSSLNLDRIQSWIDQGRIDPKHPITVKELAKSRCLHGVKRHGVKLLGRNAETLTSKINIIVSRASASAIARIEALGGSVTTRFYSPTSMKRVMSGESHPVISLQAIPELVDRKVLDPRMSARSLQAVISPNSAAINTLPARAQRKMLNAVGNLRPHLKTLSSPTKPEEAKTLALKAVMDAVSSSYKYRLADATSRKDMEYYRDPAHRGYLAHTVKDGESPSLFFKPPGEAKDRRRQLARRAAAKASADNRLF